MSNQNLGIVQNFLGLLNAGITSGLALDMLAEDVKYDWLLVQGTPIKRSLEGRQQVQSYLSILPATYRILEATEPTFHASADKVVVLGGEHALVVRTKQLIRADWNAVFQLAAGHITHITMSIYKWVILGTDSPHIIAA